MKAMGFAFRALEPAAREERVSEGTRKRLTPGERQQSIRVSTRAPNRA